MVEAHAPTHLDRKRSKVGVPVIRHLFSVGLPIDDDNNDAVLSSLAPFSTFDYPFAQRYSLLISSTGRRPNEPSLLAQEA